MRILLFAPNGGVSLSTGGGTKYLLRSAEILAGDLGQEVTIAGYHSLPLSDLERLHGVSLERHGVQLRNGPGGAAYQVFRRLPFKASPYAALLSRSFSRWTRKVLEEARPDLVWFHDDVPRAAARTLGSTRAFLYVHFPLGGRAAALVPPLAESRSAVERIDDALLRGISGGILAPQPGVDSIPVWTNSTVTSSVLRQLGRPGGQVVYNYVAPAQPNGGAVVKEPLVIAVGAFSRGKGYHLLIDAFARANLPGWRLQLIGHSRDPAYSAALRNQLVRAGLERRVDLRTDASPGELEDALRRASIIVSAASFEPFGLAFLEGMSYGAVPLTLQSAFTGCWTDILNRGQFGRGFRSAPELAGLLEEVGAGPDRPEVREAARERSRFFSRSRLVESLRSTIE